MSDAKDVTPDVAIEADVETAPHVKDPLAVELGRRGGLKGGPARAAKLSAARLSAIGTQAARARWGRKPKGAPSGGSGKSPLDNA